VKLVTAKTAATYSLNGQPVLEFSLELQTADVRKFGGVLGTFASGIPEAKVASIAPNAVDAAALATDAVNEIQSGLLLAASYTAPANSTVALIYALLQLTDADVALMKIRTLLALPAIAPGIASGLPTLSAGLTVTAELDSAALQPVLDAIAALEAGSLSAEQAALLITIGQRTAQIVGARLSVVGAVTPGGTIQLIVAKDYVTAAANGLTRTITDAGAVLHSQLNDAAQSAVIRFGAGRAGSVSQITGTISSVTHSGGVTSIVINIPRSGIPDSLLPAADYTYQIERQTSTGLLVPVISGDLTVLKRVV